MLFASIEFLLWFFPVVFGVYYLLPRGGKNYWLLLSSLLFYAWGEPFFVFAMMGSIVFNYAAARLIARPDRTDAGRRALLAVAVAANLGLLAVFKYSGFVLRTIHRLIPGTEGLFTVPDIALPIGISFFTFQAISYIVDVYRGIPAQKNLFHLGLYISCFPQLIAGPIVRYSTVRDQIDSREITFRGFSHGLMRFLLGLNKKMLLANILAPAADRAFAGGDLSTAAAWLGAVCYALQIYFDFSGYSDMAIGLGEMLGFRYPENFDHPYTSGTVTEFWRRWHISLGTWFRDYVYIPLGGSRVKSRGRLMFNLMLVWGLTGLWHGADWTFLFWGLIYGVVITAEKIWDLPRRLEKSGRPAQALYQVFTLLVVLLNWVLFRADGLNGAAVYYRTMFGLAGTGLADGIFYYTLREYAVYLAVGILCCTRLFPAILKRAERKGERAAEKLRSVGYLAQMALFFLSFSCLVMRVHNPFIYFNF